MLLPLAIIKMSADYKRAKHEAKRLTHNEGLPAGELRALIQGAVEEAQAPLLHKIEALERRLAGGAATSPLEKPVLERLEESDQPLESRMSRRSTDLSSR